MGNKKGHKGARRRFTNPQEIENRRIKEEKEKEWRRKRGETIDSEEDEEDEEESEEDTSSNEEGEPEEPLIEICNPNRAPPPKPAKKNVNGLVEKVVKVELSRREREEIEKQRSRENYLKKHAEGATDQARADLARLAIIRQKREEAAKKREALQKKDEEVPSSSKAVTKKK